MSDISITFTWYELLLFSPVLGWPGLFVGGVLGALVWRKRPILAAVIGAAVGNISVFLARMMLL